MKTRRENEPVFSKVDMLRFARYLANGKSTESQRVSAFRSWSDGPEGRRFKWIKD